MEKKERKYRGLHWMDRSLDVLLLLAVISGIFFLAIEFLFETSSQFHTFILQADVFLLGIFFVDMSRTFFKSRNIFDFMRHNWIDMIIVTVIIISLSSVVFMGLGRLSWLAREEKVFGGTGKLLQSGVIGRVLRRIR